MSANNYLNAKKIKYKFCEGLSVKILLEDYKLPSEDSRITAQVIGADLYISFSDEKNIQLQDLPMTERLRIITERTMLLADEYGNEKMSVMPIIT